MLKHSFNKEKIQPGDYVQLQTGTVHLVTSIDNDYICIQTLKGDIWVLKTEIVSVNFNHK